MILPEKLSSIEQIAQAIKKYNSFVVVAHKSPDADAYGSSSAMALILKKLGKQVYLLNESGIVGSYIFIPEVSTVQDKWPQVEASKEVNLYECLIFCDCGDKKRIGDRLYYSIPEFKNTINIDHHISNDGFANLNYVRGNASSTVELVFEIVTYLQNYLGKQLIDRNIATCLLSGLMADTGSFNFPSTTPAVFNLAAKLLEYGASTSEISSALFYNDSFEKVKMCAEALSTVELFYEGKLAFASISKDLMRKYNSDASQVEGLVDQVRRIAGIKVAVLMYQDSDIWKVSLRVKDSTIDLSKIAAEFGGGGHKAASGFRSKLAIGDLKIKILERFKSEF